MQIEALEKRKNAWKKRHHDFLFLCQDFVKEEKKQDNYYDLESTYSCESMKIHGNGVNICVFFVHFTDHQSVIYVPCPRSGHPTRASNSVKKRMHKNPSFVSNPIFPKTKAENSIQKKKEKSWKSLNVKV